MAKTVLERFFVTLHFVIFVSKYDMGDNKRAVNFSQREKFCGPSFDQNNDQQSNTAAAAPPNLRAMVQRPSNVGERFPPKIFYNFIFVHRRYFQNKVAGNRRKT